MHPSLAADANWPVLAIAGDRGTGGRTTGDLDDVRDLGLLRSRDDAKLVVEHRSRDKDDHGHAAGRGTHARVIGEVPRDDFDAAVCEVGQPVGVAGEQSNGDVVFGE